MNDTDLATHTADPVTVPDLGHPVRSFVLVMVALSLLLAAVKWAGVVSPEIQSVNHFTANALDGRELTAVLLHNDSWLPATVEDVRFVGPGWTDVALIVQDPGEGITEPSGTGERIRSFEIQGTPDPPQWIVVVGRPPCGNVVPAKLEVTIRSWIGVHETIDVDVYGSPTCGPVG